MRCIVCASHVLSREFRMLAVCVIQEENRMEVKVGSRDIYIQVPAISWFNWFCWLTNTNWPSLYLAEQRGTP
jgi:hypothetical protein